MAYFDQFPNILIPSPFSDKTSSNDFVAAKNIFKRGKIREDFFESTVAFSKYSVLGDDRPDNVAKEIYDDSSLDWVILISNNIINVRDEWPMNQQDFNRYLNNKYTPERLSSTKYYETKEVRNGNGILLLQAGQIVDSDFTFEFTNFGSNNSLSGSQIMTSVSHYEDEVRKNDAKRAIFTLRPNYLDTIMEDMKKIMTYTDSSQFINKRMKKGENLRILSPR
jgi:hypothetical protein|tara:strand:- start:82 stop:747 length:666 start_codon:yes stop_codon:yes gene_type:complete